MTKEEKIKEEWLKIVGKKDVKALMDDIDSDGWMNIRLFHNTLLLDTLDIKAQHYGTYVRPPSLSGIENNNCWIKLEDNNEFPTYDSKFITYNSATDKINNNPVGRMTMWKNYKKGLITHYQPIQKPLKPIF